MNKRFLSLAALATVLSVGTYAGLNILKPYKHETPKVADVTSPDQVFGASVDNPEAHAEEEAPAAAAGAEDSAAAVQPADTAVQPAGSVDPTAAPAEAVASGEGSVAPLVPAGEVASAPAADDMAGGGDMAAADVPSEPVVESAPEPEPAPAVEEPAPAPAPVAEAPKKVVKKNPAHAAYKAPKVPAQKVWWPAEKADQLSLIYAGQASYKKAVVLMFNGAFFQTDTAAANVKVTNKAGKAVSGTWEVGANNRRMLVLPVDSAGVYKVSIGADLTDSKGRKLGSKIGGPVSIN